MWLMEGFIPDHATFAKFKRRHGKSIKSLYRQVAKKCIRGKARFRSIRRDQYEPYREAAAQRLSTAEGKSLYRKRAPTVEGVFGTLKHASGIRRFKVRGLDAVRSEWTRICAAYNLKKLLAYAAQPAPGPFPAPAGPFANRLSSSIRLFLRIRRLMRRLVTAILFRADCCAADSTPDTKPPAA